MDGKCIDIYFSYIYIRLLIHELSKVPHSKKIECKNSKLKLIFSASSVNFQVIYLLKQIKKSLVFNRN